MKVLKRIAPCFFAIVIDALGFGLVYPVMAAMFTAAHSPLLPMNASAETRHFYLGLSYLLYPLFMFFGASFLGDLSDLWGRKKVLLICMLGLAIGFVLMGCGVEWRCLWLLLVGRAFTGLMAGSQGIAQASIADLSEPSAKARNMALISLSYAVGLAFGPVMGGVLSDPQLVSWFGFSVPFWVTAGLCFMAFLWVFWRFEETARPAVQQTLSLFRPIAIFISAFEDKKVRWLALVYLLMQVGWSLYFQFLVVHMHQAFAYGRLEMGLLQALFGVGSAFGLLLGVPLLRLFLSSQAIAATMFVFTAIGVFLAAIIPIQWPQWVLAFYICCVNAMAFATILTVFSDVVSEDRQGWVMGVTAAVLAVSWVISGLASNLIGWIDVQGLMIVGTILLLLASLLLALFKGVQPNERNDAIKIKE